MNTVNCTFLLFIFRTPDHDVFWHLATTYSYNHPYMNDTSNECPYWGYFPHGVTNGAGIIAQKPEFNSHNRFCTRDFAYWPYISWRVKKWLFELLQSHAFDNQICIL